jgi:hypothetical protein
MVFLTVSDFLGAGTPAQVTITAATASSFAEIQIIRACDIVDLLAANQVRSKGNQTAFCNFIRQAVSDLQKGKKANAIGKINSAIERTDGSVLRGQVDGNGPGMDWITDATAQAAIYQLLQSAFRQRSAVDLHAARAELILPRSRACAISRPRYLGVDPLMGQPLSEPSSASWRSAWMRNADAVGAGMDS